MTPEDVSKRPHRSFLYTESTTESTSESTAENTKQERTVSPNGETSGSALLGQSVKNKHNGKPPKTQAENATVPETHSEPVGERGHEGEACETSGGSPTDMDSVFKQLDAMFAQQRGVIEVDAYEPIWPELEPLPVQPKPHPLGETTQKVLKQVSAPVVKTSANQSTWKRTDFPHWFTSEQIIAQWGEDTRLKYTASEQTMQASVAYAFGIARGGFAGKRAQQLLGTANGKVKEHNISPAMNPTEIVGFGLWYRQQFPEQQMVGQAEQIANYVLRYRDYLQALSKDRLANFWKHAESRLAHELKVQDPHSTEDVTSEKDNRHD